MEVPWYLNQRGPGTKARLVTDPKDMNKVIYQHQQSVNFEVLIPQSLKQNKTAGRVLQYGHGLFGSMTETENAYLLEQANRFGYVLIATDWTGMSNADEAFVVDMFATNITNIRMIPDRLT